MDNGTQRASILFGVIALVVPNVGCAALHWRANKADETIAAEEVALRAVENISYENPRHSSPNYQPSPATTAPYTWPSRIDSTATGSESSSCTNGCCQ